MTSPCSVCNFDIWNPYGQLSVSSLGLYSDSRFPGRTILRLDQHFDQLDEIPADLSAAFFDDVQQTVWRLKEYTGALRVNLAILGNSEPHIHAHLIPRKPIQEPEPNKSPWDDPRPRTPLEPAHEELILSELRTIFGFNSAG